jgi:hypothetical protein
MKKSELIDLLNALPGNPDICFWNGYVGDFMHFSKELVPMELVKEDPKFLRQSLDGEAVRDGTPKMTDEEFAVWFKAHRRKVEWEMPNPYVSAERFDQWYGKKRKQIVLLQTKPRGKEDFDRMGKIEY